MPCCHAAFRVGINTGMDPQTATAQILFALKVRDRTVHSPVPATMTASVECRGLSPFDLDAIAYHDDLREREDWCEERAPGAYAARAFHDGGRWGMRFWFAD